MVRTILVGIILMGSVVVRRIVVGIDVACTIVVGIVMPIIAIGVEMWLVSWPRICVRKIAVVIDVPAALVVRVVAVRAISMIEVCAIKMFVRVR